MRRCKRSLVAGSWVGVESLGGGVSVDSVFCTLAGSSCPAASRLRLAPTIDVGATLLAAAREYVFRALLKAGFPG